MSQRHIAFFRHLLDSPLAASQAAANVIGQYPTHDADAVCAAVRVARLDIARPDQLSRGNVIGDNIANHTAGALAEVAARTVAALARPRTKGKDDLPPPLPIPNATIEHFTEIVSNPGKWALREWHLAEATAGSLTPETAATTFRVIAQPWTDDLNHVVTSHVMHGCRVGVDARTRRDAVALANSMGDAFGRIAAAARQHLAADRNDPQNPFLLLRDFRSVREMTLAHVGVMLVGMIGDNPPEPLADCPVLHLGKLQYVLLSLADGRPQRMWRRSRIVQLTTDEHNRREHERETAEAMEREEAATHERKQRNSPQGMLERFKAMEQTVAKLTTSTKGKK